MIEMICIIGHKNCDIYFVVSFGVVWVHVLDERVRGNSVIFAADQKVGNEHFHVHNTNISSAAVSYLIVSYLSDEVMVRALIVETSRNHEITATEECWQYNTVSIIYV